MNLPTVESEHVEYWTIRIRDKFRPEGEEWYERFYSKESAENKIEDLVRKKLAIREAR